jgi:phospholipid/cholesterol/gamma-HCH transport system substrate-binding protein
MTRARFRLIARRYWAVLACIGVFMALATGVGAYILDNVRFQWPWDDVMRIEATMTHGQAISPGQGQAVTVAGVTVGQIASVKLEDGVAVVGLDLEPDRVGPVYRNATLVMRPRTLGQDQTMELDPGKPDPGLPDDGRLGDGDRLGISATQVNINPDEILATLDADARTYLKLLLHANAEGLRGRESDLRHALKLSEPTLSQLRRVTGALAGRRAELRQLVSNLRRLSESTAEKDTELASLVTASSAVFGAIGEREVELGAAVERLPGALASTRAALREGGALAEEAAPALDELRPAARRLVPALRAARPLLREGTPIVRDDLRPLVRETTPLMSALRPPLRSLNRATPPLIRTGELLNYLANELGYNPEGPEEGHLFWTAWFAHNLSSALSAEDAHGGVIRGLIQVGCSSVPDVAETVPVLLPLVESGVCP